MLAALCCPSPNQLATRAPRRMGQAECHEAGSHGDGDLDQLDRPLAFHRPGPPVGLDLTKHVSPQPASQPVVGIYSTVHQLDMAVAPQSSPWKRQPSKTPCQQARTRRTPCQLTNHEEGATNAQCQRAQAPELLMKRCVSSMTRLPACLAILGGLPIAILWQLGLHVLCFFVHTHVFSWVGRSYATTKLIYIYIYVRLCICVSI